MKKISSFTVLIISLMLLFICNSAKANMASPFIEGTKAASAISSRHVDILHESIFIQIDSFFVPLTIKTTFAYGLMIVR